MTILGESLTAGVAGAALGGLTGAYFGHPWIGAATGGAVAGGMGALYGGAKAVVDSFMGEQGEVRGFTLPTAGPSVGFLQGGYGELIGGPGPWTPERLFAAQQYEPDQYGWAMRPRGLQSAYGPALAQVRGTDTGRLPGGHGPAYLMMPYNATLPGSTTPPAGYFQQDVAPRAAEAAAQLRLLLARLGIHGESNRILNGYGVRFRATAAMLGRARQVAGTLAQTANLAAVLVERDSGSYAIYFTDYPSMVFQAAQAHGQTADRIAGLEETSGAADSSTTDWIGSPAVHYGIAGVSGAAAGASLSFVRPTDIPLIPATLGGALMGGGIAYLTREQRIPAPPNELPTERVGREAIEASMANQTGRWLNLLLWGPMMVATGYLQPNPTASVLSVASGAVLVGTSALDLANGYRLKVKHTEALRAREAMVRLPAVPTSRQTGRVDLAALRNKISRLKGASVPSQGV